MVHGFLSFTSPWLYMHHEKITHLQYRSRETCCYVRSKTLVTGHGNDTIHRRVMEWALNGRTINMYKSMVFLSATLVQSYMHIVLHAVLRYRGRTNNKLTASHAGGKILRFVYTTNVGCMWQSLNRMEMLWCLIGSKQSISRGKSKHQYALYVLSIPKAPCIHEMMQVFKTGYYSLHWIAFKRVLVD